MPQTGKYTTTDLAPPPLQKGAYSLTDITAHQKAYDPTSPEDNPSGYLMEQAKAAFQAHRAAGTSEPSPGMTEGPGLRNALSDWVEAGPIQMGQGAVDVSKGHIARGGHQIVSGAGNTAVPAMPFLVGAAPIATTVRAVGGGLVGGKVAEGTAQILGANEEQKQFSGDIGNILGGFVASSGLPRALLETPAKELAAKHGTTLLNLLQPRKAIIGKLNELLADAVAKQSIPAAAAPSLSSAPAASVNALERPLVKAPTLSGPPSMEIYKEPLMADKPVPPRTMFDDLKEWDHIRQIHDQLEKQIGLGQDEIDTWMQAHNQQAPGAKPSTKPAQDYADILQKSIDAANAKKQAAVGAQ